MAELFPSVGQEAVSTFRERRLRGFLPRELMLRELSRRKLPLRELTLLELMLRGLTLRESILRGQARAGDGSGQDAQPLSPASAAEMVTAGP